MKRICPECHREIEVHELTNTWQPHDTMPPLRQVCRASSRGLEEYQPLEEFGDVYALYAFIAKDVTGQEGIVAMPTPNGPMPLIGADMERIKDLVPYAQMAARARQQPVTLALFSGRTGIETIEPGEG